MMVRTVMKVYLLLLRQHLDIVWVVNGVGKVVGVVELRQTSFLPELGDLALVMPDLAYTCVRALE